MRIFLALTLTTLLVVGMGYASLSDSILAEKPLEPAKVVHRIELGENVQETAQEALILVKPGEVVEFGEGKFEFTSQLSLTVDGVTIRGQGIDKTILSFRAQDAGSEAIKVSAVKDFEIADLAVEDAKGDAIKVQDSNGVVFRRVRTEWTDGPKETNGAYGLYPVLCEDVLIDGCVAIGASDAGIYVGQSKNIVVRNSRAESNVAGIEIENSIGADVYRNVATNNTGGILVFNLPGLKIEDGRDVRVFDNKVVENNHPNFAPKGNIVANVPPGTGVMVMAIDNVEIFQNSIVDNQTCSTVVVEYIGKKVDSKNYDPFSEGIYIHHNEYVGGGNKPSGALGTVLKKVVGVPLPDILIDTGLNKERFPDGKLPPELQVHVHDNGDASFAALDLSSFDPSSVVFGKIPDVKINRDASAFTGKRESVPPVSLASAEE